MTNFDFLAADPQFTPFARAAAAAEKIYAIDPAACVLNCRRAMEFAVKWMYSVDGSLVMPWQDNLVDLLGTEEFRDIVGTDLWRRLDWVRRIGNHAAHGNKAITPDKAQLCLQNLHQFMDFVACCYGTSYTETHFDPALLTAQPAAPVVAPPEIDFDALLAENKALKQQLTARRQAQQADWTAKPLELSEYKTRKLYIDTLLLDAGWVEGRDWLNEVELHGMPNKSGVGYADYVLYDAAQRPLAVIEAKRTCVDVARGRQQAKLYADILEKQFGRRPVVFLTNGFETRILDGQYPERPVAAFYSRRDLEKWFNLRTMRTSLADIAVNKNIAGRYYQEEAVKAVCRTLDEKNRRRALLVMATGSGKTRTVISLCDVLLRHGWVKNILFLADRNSLVTQAKRSFVNLLPDLSVTNLCEEKDNAAAHCVFSTYQTMMHCIDTVSDEKGKLFTAGHFDLVVCDEAHRSIYNKYKDIFAYFDAPLVGLTATPKDEIDKNTYEVFQLGNGTPTYGYELAQAVDDGFLVDFISVETQLKFIEQGIVYDDLSPEDKQIYENTFRAEDGHVPEKIEASALNAWVFNTDTIRQVLHILMRDGLKVDYGEKLGKTIIFAKNHLHAEKILEVFHAEYPQLTGYAKVIDNYMTYAQSAIDEFSDPAHLPQIAISVDMLDTGIDVPEVLNLVFFKKVYSKAKFWQMIGRGTRLCPGLLDGADKDKFYIFDFCGNFAFFRMNEGKPTANQIALQGALFCLKAQITYKLQDIACQTEELKPFRAGLVAELLEKVQALNRDNFAVRQHLRCVEQFSRPESWQALTYEDTLWMEQEIAPLLLPDEDDPKALRFDALVYNLELAYLAGQKNNRARAELLKKAAAVAGVANIPAIQVQTEFLHTLLHTDYLDRAGIPELETIRKNLRDLMKYIVGGQEKYLTDLNEQVLSTEWHESELENDDLKNYKVRAEYYVRQHTDNIAIMKLKSNIPLTPVDLSALENILWSEVGSREDYEAEYGQKPLGEFVREIVGMDMAAAKQAFGRYLSDVNLDDRQIYFVNQIVEYIVQNGMMKDLSVLQETPFTDRGNLVELFSGDLSVWNDIRQTIAQINANAETA